MKVGDKVTVGTDSGTISKIIDDLDGPFFAIFTDNGDHLFVSDQTLIRPAEERNIMKKPDKDLPLTTCRPDQIAIAFLVLAVGVLLALSLFIHWLAL